MRKLELLASAKNLECGIAAISHGADAVYIGAERFGARAAAGNSLEDIQMLCEYAHRYGARVFVTVNTIVYEDELDDTQQLLIRLSEIGVDAVLVQDMGVIEMRRSAIAEVGHALLLHASTQCDTRTAEKVSWLQSLGFSRAVLARELSLTEISAIHAAVPDMELEVFVHGALCVSYSGVCYASQHCFGRSANRGECAQFCRMKFDLVDADGQIIEHDRHLLSLKDMSQIDNIEALAASGACSFKIEGRLKDVGYVKNVVSAFSRRIDNLIKKYPDRYCRASLGKVDYHFEPNLRKTFNRGFTSYFLHGRTPDIASFDTPKALGEHVGHVKEIRNDSFNVAGTASFSNGDGLCFINGQHELEGFRVNRVEGNRLFPFKMPKGLKPNMALYRNNDVAFGKILSGETAERRIAITMFFGTTDDGFCLDLEVNASATDHPLRASAFVSFDHQIAKTPQTDNIRRQLLKLGATVFSCDEMIISPGADQWFVPSSLLSDLRRQATDALADAIASYTVSATASPGSQNNIPANEEDVRAWHPAYRKFTYLYNVSNHLAHDFYATHGMPQVGPALEVEQARHNALVMQCRHCLRYTLGYCVKHGGRKPLWREPLALRLGDGRRFRLEFDCSECQMNIYSE